MSDSKENFGNIKTDGKTTGTVKLWKNTYGFITPDDPKMDDVFIFHEQIEPWRKGFKTLEVGKKVRFSYHRGKKGLEAINLEIEREDVDEERFKMKKR